MKELKEKLDELEKVKTLAIDALSCMDAFGTDDWNIILTRDMAKHLLSSMGNQPPKSAGVKTATEYLMQAHGQPIAALTTQAWDHEIELEEFAQYCSEQELCSGDAGIVWLSMNGKDRIREFRNPNPRG